MVLSLYPLINAPAPVLLVLAAIATQRSVVHAQPQENLSTDYPYYWFSPGRIAGIIIGALVLVFLLLSLLILGCRRRRRAKVTPKVMVSNFSGQPQPFPSTWQGQQPVQTPYYGPDVGWVYQAPSTAAPYERAKSTELGQAQRIGPSRQAPSTTPFGEVLGASTLGQVVQRPPPTNQVGGAPDSGQVQTPAPTSQVESTTLPGRAQRYVPPGQVQSIASSVREQQQGAPIPPPPRRTPQGIPSAGASNDRDQSPPPYYPATPPTAPSSPTAR